jgi:hypothetical protein
LRKWLLLLTTTIVAAPAVARGQVGYDPAHSPFRDIDETQEVTLFSGYYKAKADVAHVAPRSGPIMGVHYQWRASGPANFTFDVSRVSSQRLVLDPQQPKSCAAKPDNCRSLGLYRWPLYFFDGTLAMSLTGARTFHGLAPEVKGGFGLASDFHEKPDLGDFGFGTRVAFLYGLGLRWIPGGRYAFRADFVNHLYSVKYPESYYQSASDSTQILAPRQKRSVWLNNPGLTIGVSYLFAR